MKKNIIILFLLLSTTKLFANPNQPITINRIDPTEVPADEYKSNSVTIYGDGFFPHPLFQDFNAGGTNDVQHLIQIQYRQISPVIGPIQLVKLGRSNDVSIVYFGPDQIIVSPSGIARKGYENTVWSFSICATNVGCSNSANLKITGPGSNEVTLLSGSNPVDVAAGSVNQIVKLQPRGLRGNVTTLRLGGSAVYGDFDGNFARFVLPAYSINTPGLINAFVEDAMTSSDSESFLIRVFGKPQAIIPAPLSILQNLRMGQPAQDANLSVSFAQMTFPSNVVFQDGAKSTTINIALDLLTNKAQIKIPASALRIGKYTASLIFSNIAGQSEVIPLNIEINGTIRHPIPTPGPIPRPF